MLGRLGMAIDDCLEMYKKLGHEIFGKPRIRHISKRNPFLWHPRSKYNHQKFQELIASLVDEREPPPPDDVGRRNHLLEAPAGYRNRVYVHYIQRSVLSISETDVHQLRLCAYRPSIFRTTLSFPELRPHQSGTTNIWSSVNRRNLQGGPRHHGRPTIFQGDGD